MEATSVFWGAEEDESGRLALLLKQIVGYSPLRAVSRVDERRRRRTEVGMALSSIHPNPGPQSEGRRSARRERRRMRRARRREERERRREEERAGGVRVKEQLVVVTWNVQSMSMESLRRRKLRMVVSYAEKSGWDVVLLSEVRASGSGVVWLGQDERLVVIVHSERAGVMMRGEALKRWCEGGQRKRWSERHVAVKVEEWVFVATYMPVWSHGRDEEIENEREKLLEHVRWAENKEVVVVGGDFNAHIGGGRPRSGVNGRFGLRASND